jgi:diguanylate cyclase (GGDEF)-like protein
MPSPRLSRERWPTAVGIAGAAVLLVALAVARRTQDLEWSQTSILGLDPGIWGAAVSFLALFLVLQIVLNARTVLERERRLVEIAADLRETSAELERLARVDQLTGVLNRGAFFDRLGTEFRRTRRYERPLSVLMIDIDHFKSLNDRHGHATGDAVLAACARLMASSLRESDELGRYGGEEFAAFLPETKLVDAATVAEKLRAAVEALGIEPIDASGSPIHVTISVGVAGLPDLTVADHEALVRRADDALYNAKRSGRNRIATAPMGGMASVVRIAAGEGAVSQGSSTGVS